MLYRLFVLVQLLVVFELAAATCLVVLVCRCSNRISRAETSEF